jgi:RND superfamily putative drug exporter
MDDVTTREPAAGAPSLRPPNRRRLPRQAVVVGLLGVLMFLVGGFGGSYQGRLGEVQKNDNSAYLPATAESTRVSDEQQRFNPVQTIPGFLVYERPGGLTAADKAKIAADLAAVRRTAGVAVEQVSDAAFSADGTTANVSVPLIGRNGSTAVGGPALLQIEQSVIATAKEGAPAGLVVHSAGPGGLLVAFIDAFSGIDSALLLAAGVVVVLILLIVYRSPVLWFFPLFSAVLALGAAALVVYQLAKHGVLTLTGQSQGILSVLVLGAGTDYALLLISRYREELHNYDSRVDAMMRAWRGAAPAIAASAATVIVGLMCLTFGELNSDRSLGPVCADLPAGLPRPLRPVGLLAAGAARRPCCRHRHARRLGLVRRLAGQPCAGRLDRGHRRAARLRGRPADVEAGRNLAHRQLHQLPRRRGGPADLRRALRAGQRSTRRRRHRGRRRRRGDLGRVGGAWRRAHTRSGLCRS